MDVKVYLVETWNDNDDDKRQKRNTEQNREKGKLYKTNKFFFVFYPDKSWCCRYSEMTTEIKRE